MGKFIDLTGQTFGDWKVVSYNGNSYWNCKCTHCGQERVILGYKLKNSTPKCDCTHERELIIPIGTVIDDMTVIGVTGTQDYDCKCKCGRIVHLKKYDLTHGRRTICGHVDKKDLTGKKFGEWTVLRHSYDRMWTCQCSCGTIRDVQDYSLTHGKSLSCGKCNTQNSKVTPGVRFGEWEVLSIVSPTMALCKCSCGKTREVNIYTLLNGKSTSCGHTMNQDRVLDLTGRQFGELTALRYLGNHEWECQCSCGKIIKQRRDHLLDGRATSCGHGTCREPIDMRGKRFGKLEVIKYVGNKMWLCKCDCGNYKEIAGANLRNHSIVSCGCLLYTPTYDELNNKIAEYIQLNNHKPTIHELAEFVGINYKQAQYHLKRLGLNTPDKIYRNYRSRYESEISQELISMGLGDNEIEHNVTLENVGYELDIYIPKLKLALEFNGTYWHSTLYKSPTYHQNKTIECARHGIRVIHIFEYEWSNTATKDKIVRLIKSIVDVRSNNVIHARNLYIKEISSGEAKDFFDKYHLGNGVYAKYNLALTDKLGEIYGAISFGPGRFNEAFEIYRMAFKDNCIITGGAERLFSHFTASHPEISTIETYVDISKFTGNSYLRLGFKTLGITKPGYVWASKNEVISRYMSQKHYLVTKGLGDLEQTEDEIMSSLGYLKIYDCGNLRMRWNRQ